MNINLKKYLTVSILALISILSLSAQEEETYKEASEKFLLKELYQIKTLQIGDSIDFANKKPTPGSEPGKLKIIRAAATSILPPDTTRTPKPLNIIPRDSEFYDWKGAEFIYYYQLDYFNKKTGKSPTAKERKPYYQYLSWPYMYSPINVIDFNVNKTPKTAWAENKKDFGKGEMLLVHIDYRHDLIIYAGLGKSPAIFKQNNRPKEINIYLFYAKDAHDRQFDATLIAPYQLIGKGSYTLKDYNGFQDLLVPDFPKETKKQKFTEQLFLVIEIVSVYPGTLHNDTCISSIMTKDQYRIFSQ